MTTDNFIEIENVSFSIVPGRPVLENIDFHLPRGRVVARGAVSAP